VRREKISLLYLFILFTKIKKNLGENTTLGYGDIGYGNIGERGGRVKIPFKSNPSQLSGVKSWPSVLSIFDFLCTPTSISIFLLGGSGIGGITRSWHSDPDSDPDFNPDKDPASLGKLSMYNFM
jgi:hypothetical protein